MAVESPAPKRADAQRNRTTILEAARQLLAEVADFPMSEVARRAGVGQGTLYRNFPDKARLVAAVMEDEIDHVEELAAQHADDPDAFFVLLRALAERGRFNALAELAREDPEVGTAIELGRGRIRGFMAAPLQRAKASGGVRRDFTIDDVLVVLWMVRGAASFGADPQARAACASRALSLVLTGISPSR